jgi:hypothetical protein
MGYFFSENCRYGPPFNVQHPQSLVSDPSAYLCFDDSFEDFYAITQHSVMPSPPSSDSSELGNALGEIQHTQPQRISHADIALPGLPPLSQVAPNCDPLGGSFGLDVVKTGHGMTASGQRLSPISPLDSLSPTDHMPDTKEEGQEELHICNLRALHRASLLHGRGSQPHRQHSLDLSWVAQDHTPHPEFASSTKVCWHITIAHSCLSEYRCSHRRRPFLILSLLPPGACISMLSSSSFTPSNMGQQCQA